MNNLSTLRYVDHTYRDFSRYIEEGGKLIKHKKSGNNFPARLHKVLSDHNEHAITWMPHGRAWKIIDKELLINQVIPNYYVCKKYESFTRQLNGWGFKRLHQSGPDSGCYYHECFLRSLPKLTCLIRRLPPNLGKSTPFAEGEPNFYRISEAYPLPLKAAPSQVTPNQEISSSSAAPAPSPAFSIASFEDLLLDRPANLTLAPSEDTRKSQSLTKATSLVNSMHHAGRYLGPNIMTDSIPSQVQSFNQMEQASSSFFAAQFFGNNGNGFAADPSQTQAGQPYQPMSQQRPANIEPPQIHFPPNPNRAPGPIETLSMLARSLPNESSIQAHNIVSQGSSYPFANQALFGISYPNQNNLGQNGIMNTDLEPLPLS